MRAQHLLDIGAVQRVVLAVAFLLLVVSACGRASALLLLLLLRRRRRCGIGVEFIEDQGQAGIDVVELFENGFGALVAATADGGGEEEEFVQDPYIYKIQRNKIAIKRVISMNSELK